MDPTGHWIDPGVGPDGETSNYECHVEKNPSSSNYGGYKGDTRHECTDPDGITRVYDGYGRLALGKDPGVIATDGPIEYTIDAALFVFTGGTSFVREESCTKRLI